MSGHSGTVDNVSPYGYTPTRAVAAVFIVLFVLSTLAHVIQAARSRMWWLLYTACLCGCIELLGWFSRFWSSYSPTESLPFQLQIIATIIGPTPLLAASFVVLGTMIKILGLPYSRFSPKWYTIIFTSCDISALVVQGAGGAIAATASDLQGANKGANIMLFGIVFQLIVVLGFSACAIEYFIRYITNNPFATEDGPDSVSEFRGKLTTKIKLMTATLAFSTTCLFIRSIYRIIELAGGWHGRIIHTQIYFNVLDGMMVILAIYALNIFHPGILLKQDEKEGKETDSINSV